MLGVRATRGHPPFNFFLKLNEVINLARQVRALTMISEEGFNFRKKLNRGVRAL
jgi:hypothetical protein